MNVSIISSADGTVTSEAVPTNIISDIRNGRFSEPVNAIRDLYQATMAKTGDIKAAKRAVNPLKKALPAVMWSGIFSKRGDKFLTRYSGLLCADLDLLMDSVATSIMERSQNDPHVYAGFHSPTGTGVKLVFRVSDNGDDHRRNFETVKEYVARVYQTEVDEACKNVERICFVSHDPSAFLREEAEPLPLLPTAAPKVKTPAMPNNMPSGYTRQTITEKILGAVRWVSETEGFCTCPGASLHSTADGARDCKVNLDGPPTIFCFHDSCKGIVDGVNHELRSRIGKAEAGTISPGKSSPRIEAASPVGTFDEITANMRGQIIRCLTSKGDAGAKRTEIAKLVVSSLAKVGRFYFHADLRDFNSAMFFDSSRKKLSRISSDLFSAWLSEWIQLNRAENWFKFVLSEIETTALSSSITTGIVPETFWASRPGVIYLSNGDGQILKITPGNTSMVDNGTDGCLFAAGKTLAPWKQTTPRDIFETAKLFSQAHCAADHGKHLLRLWTYSLPTNPRSKPPLCPAGDVGSGKTRTVKGIAEFYGLPFIAQKVEEEAEDSFWPCVNEGGLFCLDNADTKCRWLADALANAATDGCSQRRKLYSNAETVVLRARAWIAVTTANPTFASDAGLADRLLLVRMGRHDGDTSDQALSDEIAANRDAGLSFVSEALACALADTAPTPGGLNQRHPDFAAFAVKIGRAIGRESESIAVLRAAEADKSAFCLENDTIGAALLAYLKRAGSFSGTSAELVPHLIDVDRDLEGRLSAKRLGKRLKAIWPHLKSSLSKCRSETDRTGFLHFTFQATADFADFQMAFPQNPSRER